MTTKQKKVMMKKNERTTMGKKEEVMMQKEKRMTLEKKMKEEEGVNARNQPFPFLSANLLQSLLAKGKQELDVLGEDCG